MHAALEGLEGAKVALVDITEGSVRVHFDPARTNLDAIERAIDASPYERIATGPVAEISP